MSPSVDPANDPVFAAQRNTGFVRDRVRRALGDGMSSPAQVLVAPLGAGKTTALDHLLAEQAGLAARCIVEPTHATPRALLDLVQSGLAPLTGVGAGPWGTLERALRSLFAATPRSRVVLAIDDVHHLANTPAAGELLALLEHLPGWLHVAMASRRSLDPILAGSRLAADAVHHDADLLRWRHWEVEQLFAHHFRRPLPPREAARLTHRTDGWSAGIQLFHLATRDLGPTARSEVLRDLRRNPGLVRDFLTRHVIEALSTSQADFLVDTSVMGPLRPAVCDAVRGRSDSREIVADLVALGVPFTGDVRHGLRLHHVLRVHVEAMLVRRDGWVEVKRRARLAGQVFERSDMKAAALECYARAESQDVHRLLREDGDSDLSSGMRRVLARLPRSLVAAEPWLQVSRARQCVADGRLLDATMAYDQALRGFGRTGMGEMVRQEAATVAAWLDPREVPSGAVDAGNALLLRAVASAPRRQAAAVGPGDSAGVVIAGAFAMVLAGDMRAARGLARQAGSADSCGIVHFALARAVAALAGVLGHPGAFDVAELRGAADTLERLEIPWPARLLRLVAACVTDFDRDEVRRALQILDTGRDAWGASLLRLVAGAASVHAGAPELGWLRVAARDLGHAPVLSCWATSWEAAARAMRGDEEAAAVARLARRDAHARVVPGARVVAEFAEAVAADGPDRDTRLQRAHEQATALGLQLPARNRAWRAATVSASIAPTTLRVFGGLRCRIDGNALELDGLRPQARTILAMLVLEWPTAVHRNRILAVLWPDERRDVQVRRLSVLVSTLRRFLEPEAEPAHWDRLHRLDDAYLLRVREPAWVDVQEFNRAVVAARTAKPGSAARVELLRVAFDAYSGPLLPEFGDVDWLVQERDHYMLLAGDVAQELATWALEQGDPRGSIEFARVGLHADRYRSTLWRLLAQANDQLGDLAAAARCRQRHGDVLEELGLEPRLGEERRSSAGTGRGAARRISAFG